MVTTNAYKIIQMHQSVSSDQMKDRPGRQGTKTSPTVPFICVLKDRHPSNTFPIFSPYQCQISSGHCGKPGRRNPAFFGMDNYPFWCFISRWIILESSGVICGFPWHFNRLGHVLPSFGKRSISVCLGWVAVLKAVKAVENSWQTRKNSIDLTGDLIVSMKKRLLKR